MYIYIYTSQKVPYLQCFTKSNKLFSPSHPANHFQNTQYTTIENPDQYSVRFIAGVSSGVFMLVDSIKPAEWDMDQKSHSYNCTLSVTAWSRFQSMQCRCCFGVLFSHRCSLQWIKHCDINVCEGLFCCKLKRVVHVFGTVFEQIIIKRVTWNKSDIVGGFLCVPSFTRAFTLSGKNKCISWRTMIESRFHIIFFYCPKSTTLKI